VNTPTASIEQKLSLILSEVANQVTVGSTFPADQMSFEDEISQIREWVTLHGEYGIAYESLVAILEGFPFKLSGPAAVTLLEVGLTFKYKTERAEDAAFDSRQTDQWDAAGV
jgi:hypothetical protein